LNGQLLLAIDVFVGTWTASMESWYDIYVVTRKDMKT
jgi:hypothetical protein